MTQFHIAVLDFNNYEVKMHRVELTVEENQAEEAVQDCLSELYNLDEIQFMYGQEPINIDNEFYQD